MGGGLQKVTRVVQFTFKGKAKDSRLRSYEIPETRILILNYISFLWQELVLIDYRSSLTNLHPFSSFRGTYVSQGAVPMLVLLMPRINPANAPADG